MFWQFGGGGGGHSGGESGLGTVAVGATTGAAIGMVIVAAASSPKEKDDTKSEAIAITKTVDSDDAVYYGIDPFGGNMNWVTGPMSFDEADAWATATAASGQYSPRAAWGLYTKDPADALSMAIWLGMDPGVVRFDLPKTDRHYPHYHTSDKTIHGISAPNFHIWFG